MSSSISRRTFLAGLGVTAAAGAASSLPAWAMGPLLYPPIDLSYFNTPITPAPSEIHLGYAAITWNGNDRQAIDDISDLGFHGIQLRSNVIKEFDGSELKDLLQKHRLILVALSSGGVRIDPAVEAEEVARHAANAKFVHDMGGLYLQVTDQKPKDRPATSADYKRLGQVLTAIGKRPFSSVQTKPAVSAVGRPYFRSEPRWARYSRLSFRVTGPSFFCFPVAIALS